VNNHPAGLSALNSLYTLRIGKVNCFLALEKPHMVFTYTKHSLFATSLVILIHEGFDVKRIQKWVGHADIETTLKIYAKVKDKEAKQEILDGMHGIIKPKRYDD
jgi:site-specific recombinase XerD